MKPGRFQLGPGRLDNAKSTVALPASTKPAYANDPLMEHLLVTNYGSPHERMLNTVAPPCQAQLVMLPQAGQPLPAPLALSAPAAPDAAKMKTK